MLTRRRLAPGPLLVPLVCLLHLVAIGPASAVPRGKAAPREILGPEVWSLLKRASRVEVALLEPRADGQFRGVHGLAATASSSPDGRWLGELREVLVRPSSYFQPRCEGDGARCPQLRCKTTPRAVVTLRHAGESAVVVITICHTLRTGRSVERLGSQVSMQPAEERLLRLLLRLFPKDARLRQELADQREASRGVPRR